MLASCTKDPVKVKIETKHGDMILELYDSTPIHRDNFVKLVKEGFYDDLLFHRVIKSFMIQGGDPDSRKPGVKTQLGQGGPGYTLEAELGERHFKGALAAARMGDNANPEKRSSGSQFYIVEGMPITAGLLDKAVANNKESYTEEEKVRYIEEGGYPFLDGAYTVFGMMIEGFDVVEKIASEDTDRMNRPNDDIKMKISIIN
jgi:peptidyl-prolyl cis-trans isomerase B (cyclophilin B)